MNKWIASKNVNSSAALRLFCFPYAGGAATIYRDWQAALPNGVEVCPILLPGRGSRFSEPAVSDLGVLVEQLADGLSSYLDRPSCFFGYSMGAMIAFELARAMRARGSKHLAHLFLGARKGPVRMQRSPRATPMSDGDFLQQLRALNGMTQVGGDNDEMVKLMLPTLRADMTVVQNYRYEDLPPLPCGITVLGGTADPAASREELLRWRAQTLGTFRLHMLEGDHFFINTHRDAVLDIVSRDLQRVLARSQQGMTFDFPTERVEVEATHARQ